MRSRYWQKISNCALTVALRTSSRLSSANVRLNAGVFQYQASLPEISRGMFSGNLVGGSLGNGVRGTNRAPSTSVLTMNCRLQARLVNCVSYPKTHETHRNSSFLVGVCLPFTLPNPKAPLYRSLLNHESTHSPIKGRQVATLSYLSQKVAMLTSCCRLRLRETS